jgi:hypothetical protein
VIGWKCSCMHSQRAARSFVRGLEIRLYTVYYYGSVHGPNNFSYITASLSHKRFDYCSSTLPCSCSLCCDFIPLHELVGRSTRWHDSKNGCKRDYCTAYLIHSVIIFKLVVLWWGMKHCDRYLDGVPNIFRQFWGEVWNFVHKMKNILHPGVALTLWPLPKENSLQPIHPSSVNKFCLVFLELRYVPR